MKQNLQEIKRLQQLAGLVKEDQSIVPGQKLTAKQLHIDLKNYLLNNSDEIASKFIPQGTPYVVEKTNDGIAFIISSDPTNPKYKETPLYIGFEISIDQYTGFVQDPNYFNKGQQQ